MNDLIIKINKETRKVDLEQTYLGNDSENLQEKLIFQFDEFVNGQARLEYELDGDKNYLVLTKEEETYTIPVQNVITIYQKENEGKIKFQLVVTEGTESEEIPVFKSNIFYLKVRPSINAVGEAPEGYDLWIEQANAKLNEIDNLDIDVSKVDNTTTVTVTKKDGTQESVEIYDGGSADAFKVTFTKEDDTITADKSILEIVQAYNNGKTITGEYISEELNGNILLEVAFILPNTENPVVELSSLFDSGDDFNSIALLGFNEDNTDSWTYFDRNIATTDDLNQKQDISLLSQIINSSSTQEQYPSAKAVYDYGDIVVDLSSYSVGQNITDQATVEKLKDDRVIIKYNGIDYRFATIYGTGYVYTVMSSLTNGAYITLNYISSQNIFSLYEVGTAYWEVPSNKAQNLNNPSTEKYPSTLAVSNALQDINPMFSVVMDESTMTLNHTAQEIYEAFTQGKLVTAMGYTAFFTSWNEGVLKISTYFGRNGQTITVQGNQITNLDEFTFVTQ